MKIKKKSKVKKYPGGGSILSSDNTKINPPILKNLPKKKDDSLKGGEYWEHRDPKKDSDLENAFEYLPGLGNILSVNDWMASGQQYFKNPTLKNLGNLSLETLGLIPFGNVFSSAAKGASKKFVSKANGAGMFFDFAINAASDENLKKEFGGNIQTYAMGGVNRYDVPAQMPTGQSFFQLPYNEIATALLSKQKSYDEQEANIAKQKAFITDLKSGYRTAGLPQEIQQEYNTKFENYIGKDLTDPNIKRALTQDLASLSSDSRLRTLAADVKQSALWDAYQQAHPDLAGAAINPYNVNGQWIPAKDAQGNWLKEQDVNNWYGNIIPHADYNKPIDDAYGKVKANVVQTLTDSGIKVQHDDVTGKDFYYKDISKKEKQYIDDTLPQWKSALEEQTINFVNSATPEARYFNARFANEIAQDPEFTKKYISTAGGKFTFKQERTEDISKQVGSGSGSGKDKEIKTASPFQITQITKTNPNLQGYKLPQESIKEIDNTVNQYIATEGKGLSVITNDKGQKEFSIPQGASIDVVNEIQAKNAKLAETQLAKQNLIDINNVVASKNGFTPNANGEYDVLNQVKDPKLYQQLKQLKQTIDNFDPVAYEENVARIGMGSPLLAGTGYKKSSDQYLSNLKNEFITLAKKDPKLANYLNELEAISKGIQLTGENAYPLVGEAFKDVNSGVMNLLIQKTNYFDGKKGGIEYLQSNDKISDDDKEYVSKLIAEKGLSELNGRTAIFWDKEKGEYATLAILPRSKSDGGDLYLKISQSLMGGLPTEAMKLDPIYNESSKQLFRKNYEDHSQVTNNVHGRIGGVTRDIETTHVMTPDLDNKGNRLNPGETVFTMPELPNIVVKVGAFDSMDNFWRSYEANKPQGTALLDLLKANGLTPITSPGFYNRYKSRELKPSFAPKQ